MFSRSKWLIVLPALILAAPLRADSGDHNWQLGNGIYAPYLSSTLQTVSELEVARFDWVLVEVNDKSVVAEMNRLLEINPRLKFLVRLWPINGGGVPGLDNGSTTFLEYLYAPGAQDKIDGEIKAAIGDLRANIANWDSVVGLDFVEEIPGWWGCGHEIAKATEPGGALPPHLAHYQAQVEKARGVPLVWDDATKRWMGQQCAATLEHINGLIKQESGGKLVFYHHATNYDTMDQLPDPLPAGFSLVKWPGYPYYYKEIIKPGVCDGFMAYPNNQTIWNNKYMRYVKQNGWPFFSQLSHPAFMRLCTWADAEQMVMQRSPQNLGYFFFCDGDCADKGAWNDDPTLPRGPEWNTRGVSTALHFRHFCAQWNIGMDVVKRYNHLRVGLDTKLDGLKAGSVFTLVAVVENPKEASFYADPAEAVARQVRVKLALPPGIVDDLGQSPALEVPVDDLPPGGRRSVTWWLTAQDPAALRSGKALGVSATSANTDPGSAQTAQSVALPGFGAHELRGAGEKWTENGFRYGGVKPTVEITPLGEPIKNPSVSDGTHTVTYHGEIWAGTRLVITGDMKATLYPDNLLAGVDDAWKDPADPTGYRACSQGYLAAGANVGKYLQAGGKYRLTVAGKATGGGNSLVILRGIPATGAPWMGVVVANSFTDTWHETSGEFSVPDDIHSLERIYLYRAKQAGTVWYGALSLVPADLPAAGTDVSAALAGQPVEIPAGTLSDFTYGDDSPASERVKVRVKLSGPG